MTSPTQTHEQDRPVLTAEQALAVAQHDASRVYRDLSGYAIRLALDDDRWHIGYELKEPNLKGGGPSYVIDALSGAILSKRYEQ